MKALALVLSALFLMAAESSYACSPFNSASYDVGFINKATSSKEFRDQLVKLGAGSESRVKSIQIESGNTVTVVLSDGCGIVVNAIPVAPKEGEIACMNFEFTAQTLCQ